MTHFYVDTSGPDQAGLLAALQWFLGRAQGRVGLLAVPTKSQLQQGLLVDTLGKAICKKLAKNEAVTDSGVTFEAVTERTRPSTWREGPVLVLYPSRSLLNKIDTLPGTTEVLVLPWAPGECDDWVEQWGATDILSGTAAAIPSLSPKVEATLERVRDAVNVRSGISHPNDRSYVVRAFKSLKEEGEPLDQQGIRAWLVREGHFDADDADTIADIAARIEAGRQVRE